MTSPGYRKRVTSLLFGLLLLRFWFGQTFELTPTEAYSWMKGTNLDWGYWDQGVLVPWLIRLGTSFFGDTELGVRWLAAAIYAGTAFVSFYQTREWFGSRAAFWTVMALVVIPVFAVPSLLMTESVACLGLMAFALVTYRHVTSDGKWYWWILSGLVTGVALLSSGSAIIWPASLLIYFMVDPERRRQLLRWEAIAMLVVILLSLLPFWLWISEPEIADIRLLQEPVTGMRQAQINLAGGLGFLAQQIFLLSPVLVVMFFLGIFSPQSLSPRDNRLHALLLCLSIPGLVVQGICAFFNLEDVHALPALYLPLVILTVHMWCDLAEQRSRVRRLAAAAMVLSAVQSLIIILPATASWTATGSGLHRPYSWKTLAQEVSRHQVDLGANLVIGESPELASVLSFYLPNQPFVYVPRGVGVQSQYDFWSGYEDSSGSNAVVVTAANREAPSQLRREFLQVDEIAEPGVPGTEHIGWRIFNARTYGSAPQ